MPVTTLPTAPQALSDTIIQTVAGKLPILNSVSTNLSASLGRAGKTVFVPVMGAGTATEYNKTTNNLSTMDGATMTNSTVTLKHFKYVDEFSPLDIQEYGMQYLMNGFAQTAAQAIVDKAWSEIGSVLLAANFTTSITATEANFGYDDIVNANYQLDQAKASMDRTVLLGNGYLRYLRLDTNITNLLNPGAQDTLRSGVIGNLCGASIQQWNGIPANAQNLAGVALGRDALLVATGVPFAEIPGFQSSVGQHESGLAVQTLVGQAETGNVRCISQILIGVGVGRATSGVRFVTA